MVHKKEKWVAALQKAVKDMKAKPSSGLPCAVATIRVIRDGLCDDIGSKAEDEPFVATIKESMNELIKSVQENRKELAGFASNASAAAKAAGFKTDEFEEAQVKE